jgi:hypothetical protein
MAHGIEAGITAGDRLSWWQGFQRSYQNRRLARSRLVGTIRSYSSAEKSIFLLDITDESTLPDEALYPSGRRRIREI